MLFIIQNELINQMHMINIILSEYLQKKLDKVWLLQKWYEIKNKNWLHDPEMNLFTYFYITLAFV